MTLHERLKEKELHKTHRAVCRSLKHRKPKPAERTEPTTEYGRGLERSRRAINRERKVYQRLILDEALPIEDVNLISYLPPAMDEFIPTPSFA
jgi:hypothetical protein